MAAVRGAAGDMMSAQFDEGAGVISAVGTGATSGKPGVALLLLGGAIGLCLLWALVVGLHQRRQSRVDLIALEARIQAKHAGRSHYKAGDHTVPESDAAQLAWSRAHAEGAARADLPKE